MVEDGAAIPPPSPLDALVRDPAIKNAIAFLVPIQPQTDRTVRVNITARQTQVQQIDQLAKKAGLTRSAYMIRSALGRRKPKSKDRVAV